MLWRHRIRARIRRQLRRRSIFTTEPATVFTGIYQDNLWANPESRSGWGSTLAGPNGTDSIRARLSELIEEFSVTSIVDVPCGDLNWLPETDLRGADYLGVDVVPDLVATNTSRFGSDRMRFECYDLTTWVPPPADLIIVRDLLIHLTNEQVLACLRNVARSGARLLLVSDYAGVRRNGDTFTGGLRLHNLRRPPFTELNFAAATLRAVPDGDGNQGRQMLLCHIAALA
jgi:SAM-dependent methyltransferase